MRDKDITVSEKHIPLRIVGFVLAVIVLIASFTYFFVMLGHKSEGYNDVEPELSNDTLVYYENIRFRYYFTGRSNDIKRQLKELRAEYTRALNRSYKLLDASVEYDQFNNIKTVNKSLGKKVVCSSELYATLKDAYARTLQNKGYNMFAGALYSEWNGVIILEDPLEYDPLFNEKEKTRLEAISEAVNDPGSFTLEFDDNDSSVKLSVSEKYASFVEEYELQDAPVIDLNLLHDAYELKLIADEIGGKGWVNGFFEMTSGLTLSLPEHETDVLIEYNSMFDGVENAAATVKMTKGSASSRFRSYAATEPEYRYYTAVKDGETYRRNPNITSSGTLNDVLASSFAFSSSASVVDVCYANIVLYAQTGAGDAAAAANAMTGVSAAYTLQADLEKTFYANAEAQKDLTAVNGWSMK